jgi:isochorismate synthase
LRSLLAEARAKAIAGQRPVLVSSVESAPSLDSLSVLEKFAASSMSDSTLASILEEGSMYWERATDGFTLAGVGAVSTIASSSSDRFDAADAALSALLRDAVVGDQSGGSIGVGPTLMGGFSFDPDGPHSDPWHSFPAAHLIVPRLLLTSANGSSWITVSALIGADGETDVGIETLVRLRNAATAVLPVDVHEGAADSFSRDLDFFDQPAAAEWRERVRRAIENIQSGSLEKVVLARAVRAEAPDQIDPYETLHHLRNTHGNAFVFGYWRGANAFVGASPERLIRLDGRSVQATSLAGTAKRGETAEEDAAIAADLLASAKDRTEHAVVLRALKKVLSEHCDDVTASAEPSTLTMSNVHHLQTEVRAHLRPTSSLLNLIGALHPTPAVGGSPRTEALRFIREVEQLDRGWYAAPIGWIGRDGGEFAVALRSAILYGAEAVLYAGCGIVRSSDPELELAESQLKLQPMKSAIAAALATSQSRPTTVVAADNR